MYIWSRLAYQLISLSEWLTDSLAYLTGKWLTLNTAVFETKTGHSKQIKLRRDESKNNILLKWPTTFSFQGKYTNNSVSPYPLPIFLTLTKKRKKERKKEKKQNKRKSCIPPYLTKTSAHSLSHTPTCTSWHVSETSRIINNDIMITLKGTIADVYNLLIVPWTVSNMCAQLARAPKLEIRVPRKKTLITSFRKCHILKPENSSPNQNSNPHSSICSRLRKADILTIAQCITSPTPTNYFTGLTQNFP